MAFKTWASGDILTAADLNGTVVKCQSLYKVVAGQTAFSLSSQNGTAVTVTYGVTFSTIIAVILSAQSSSSVPIVAYMNGAPGLSTASCRADVSNLSSQSCSGAIHWWAIGT